MIFKEARLTITVSRTAAPGSNQACQSRGRPRPARRLQPENEAAPALSQRTQCNLGEELRQGQHGGEGEQRAIAHPGAGQGQPDHGEQPGDPGAGQGARQTGQVAEAQGQGGPILPGFFKERDVLLDELRRSPVT